MLSIGELAHTTGVSRRMLRHWEESGLVEPAEVDAWTGYRRYAISQVGRVRAIAGLRAVGFGLGEIADLLGPQLSEGRLVELLRSREAELVAQIDDATACLQEVRQRLTTLREGHHITMTTLDLAPLDALRLAALQAEVGDESEIGHAVAELLPRLRALLASDDETVTQTYDGGASETITVTVGVPIAADGAPPTGLIAVTVAGADRGAIVRYPTQPNVGDAWIALDAALGRQGLRSTGVHRLTTEPGGRTILGAPVVDLEA